MAISARLAIYPTWFLQDKQLRRYPASSVGATAGAMRCWCVTSATEPGTADASARMQWTQSQNGFARVACHTLHDGARQFWPTPAQELGGGVWTYLFMRTQRDTDTSSSPTTIDVAWEPLSAYNDTAY